MATDERIALQATAEVYGNACKEIARQRREWRKRGWKPSPELDASDRRRFGAYLHRAREANAKLREMSNGH